MTRIEWPGRCRAAGFTLVEVLFVAFIAGGAMVFLLSLGQANVQLSKLNREGLLARQIAMDVLDYYGANLAEARFQASDSGRIEALYRTHAAFAEGLGPAAEMEPLFRQMDPQIRLEVDDALERSPGSGRYLPGLYRVGCTITWKESGRDERRALGLSRLVAEVP